MAGGTAELEMRTGPDPAVEARLGEPAFWAGVAGTVLLHVRGRWKALSPARAGQEADEIVAETQRRAWENRARCTGAAQAIGWVNGIARNVLKERMKAAGRWCEPPPEPPDRGPSAQAILEGREDSQRVHQTMTRLSAEERDLLHCHTADMPHRDVASRLNISIENARQKLSRALKHFRTEYNALGEGGAA